MRSAGCFTTTSPQSARYATTRASCGTPTWPRTPPIPRRCRRLSPSRAAASSCRTSATTRSTTNCRSPMPHDGTQGGRIDFAVRLSRRDLLHWSGWRSKAKEYLLGLPADEIDLAEVVAEYGRTVTEFYDWFGFASRERTLDPFRRL